MDQETRLLQLEMDRARRLTDSEEWKWAKGKLENMISAVLSIETLADYKTAGALQLEIQARKRAKGLIKSWFEEVEGLATQQNYNKQLKDSPENYIVREEE